jgi:hypothetical protein
MTSLLWWDIPGPPPYPDPPTTIAWLPLIGGGLAVVAIIAILVIVLVQRSRRR